MKTSPNTLRAVGPGVGSREVVGASETVGVTEGKKMTEGDKLGNPDGMWEFDGWEDGWDDIDGAREGEWDGLCDGMVEMVGLEDGFDEMVGWVDGLDDGASLCGNASAIIKSAAIAEVTLAISWTESTVMVDVTFSGIWPEPSKFITAIPKISYIPGAKSGCEC